MLQAVRPLNHLHQSWTFRQYANFKAMDFDATSDPASAEHVIEDMESDRKLLIHKGETANISKVPRCWQKRGQMLLVSLASVFILGFVAVHTHAVGIHIS